MPQLKPFNIQIMDVDAYIEARGMLPVTETAIFETSTRRFHPDGLFSEVIFGQIGSRDRLVKKGYIDLKTKVITPHLFKQLMTLKSFYQDVMQGKQVVCFDPKEKDLLPTDPDDPAGDTGFSYFIKMLPKIEFKQSGSTRRKDKIDLINKYRDVMLIDKLVVLPAGIRDVRIDDDFISPEKINKYYTAIIGLTRALPDGSSEERIYDAIRYQIQMKVMEVYDYITNLIEGKNGFAQGKFAARHITFGSRNVITAMPITRVTDPLGPKSVGPDEVMMPLYQCMKSCVPLMTHKLKLGFFDNVFSNQTNRIPLIDPDTLNLDYVDVDNSIIKRYTTSDGINELLNAYRNPEMHWMPISIKGTAEGSKPKQYYLYLIYDTGDEIFLSRSRSDFEEMFRAKRQKLSLNTISGIEAIPPELRTALVFAGSSAYAVYEPTYKNSGITAFVNDPSKLEELKALKIPHLTLLENFQAIVAKYPNLTIDVEGAKVIAPEVLSSWYADKTSEIAQQKVQKLKHWVYNINNLRPLTWTEMFYIACYTATAGLTTTVTRHPMLLIENLVVDKIHLTSTVTTRSVKFSALGDGASVLLPEFPVYQGKVKVSLSVHPSHLDKYDGKHDCRLACSRQAA